MKRIFKAVHHSINTEQWLFVDSRESKIAMQKKRTSDNKFHELVENIAVFTNALNAAPYDKSKAISNDNKRSLSI